jgi:hypothetical protein
MCEQEEESLKSSHGDSINPMKDNKRKNFNKMPNHKENLSGIIAPPLSNKGRPLIMITIRRTTMPKLTRINANGARSMDTTKRTV